MIIGIEGSFRLEMGWQFPEHKDFMLCNLANHQFYADEIQSGYAERYLNEQHA